MKINQKVKIVPIIIVVLLLVAAALYAYMQNDATDQASNYTESNNANDQPVKVDEGNSENVSNVETIKLQAVGDYEGDGVATRSFENGRFKHSVEANIGEPAKGKFYEGWIVKSGGIVSTGKLAKASDRKYTLNFTSDKDMLEYNKVVITEETEASGLDNNPEAHVLEGSF